MTTRKGITPRWLSLLVWFLTAPALAQAPSCADRQTIQLVRDIFAQSIERQAAGFPQGPRLASGIMDLIAVNVLSVRTAKANRTSGKQFCQGVLEVRLSPQGAAKMNNPRALAMMAQDPEMRGIRFSGKNVSHDIHFSTQLTDDGKEHFVEAVGHKMLAELVFQLVGPEAAERLAANSKQELDDTHPSEQWDHTANIQAAVKEFVSIYRKAGMAGAAGRVEACYKAIDRQIGRDAQMKQLEYCAGMDLAAYRLDSDLSKLKGFPQTAFLHLDKVTERVARLSAYIPNPDLRAGIVERWTTMAADALNMSKEH